MSENEQSLSESSSPETSPQEDQNPRGAKWLQRALLTVSLGLSAWLLWSGRGDLEQLRGVEPRIVLILVATQIVTLVVQSERLRITVQQHSSVRMPALAWFEVFVRGRLVSMIAGFVGNTVRAVELKREQGVSYTHYVSALVAQLWVSTMASLTLVIAFGDDLGAVSRGTVMIVAAAGFLAPVLVRPSFRLMPDRLASWKPLRLAASATDSFVAALRDPSWLTHILLLVVISLVVGGWTLVLAFDIAGARVGWAVAVLMLALLQVGTAVVITPGNLGVQELGMAALAGAVSIPPAIGVLASGITRATGILALVLSSAVGHLAANRRRMHEP